MSSKLISYTSTIKQLEREEDLLKNAVHMLEMERDEWEAWALNEALKETRARLGDVRKEKAIAHVATA